MTRIHIMGPPGSGKTTLARRLSSHLRVTYYELDDVAWEETYPGTDRPLDIRLHDVHRIASQPDWITEGIFLFWTDELLRTADYVAWLDMPWYLTIWRTIVRRLRWDIRGSTTEICPPTSPRKQILFLWSIILYYLSKSRTDTRAFRNKYLTVYKDKLTYCRNANDVEAFFMKVLAQEQKEIVTTLEAIRG